MDGGGDTALVSHACDGTTGAASGVLDARILGRFELIVDGRAIAPEDWTRRSAERLVKLLLVTPGHVLRREAAAELLWPDAAPGASRANLRKAVHFARRALRGDGLLALPDDRLGFDPTRVVLDLDRVEAAFELLARVRSVGRATADSEHVERSLAVILELGGSDLLPDDMYEEWLVAPREHLRSRWQRAAIDAALTARDTGDPACAMEIVDRLLQGDPTDEAAHRLAIEILAGQGRHHAARRQFDLCRRALRANLGAEPSPETVAVFRAAERTAADRMGTASTLPRVVARDVELGIMERLVARVSDSEPAVLAIRGPTGIGKSRLLRELVGLGRAAGWRVLEWQAVEDAESPAYAPLRIVHDGVTTAAEVATWAEPARSALASACPSLGVRPALTFSDRTALIEALVLAVARIADAAPLLIAIDDLPWLDEATTELLRHVVARLARERVLIATTHRDDEPIPPVSIRLLDQLRRAGGTELAVGPLGPDAVERLVVTNLGGASVQPELASWAFRLSEGNPLFCLEIIRAGRERGAVRMAGDRWVMGAAPAPDSAPDVSDTIRRLVASRTARLTATELELLGTAAELDSPFSFGTLQAVLPDLAGGLVPALDDVLASGLLVERGAGYAFAHPLYRLAVRGTSGFARRAGTRLAIARALAGCDPDASPAAMLQAAEVCAATTGAANHALVAVELGLTAARPLAVALGLVAGDRLSRLFDPAADSLLERSLVAWSRLPPDVAGQFAASRAYCSLANLRMRAGDDAAATAAFRRAIATADDPAEVARAHVAFWWLPYRHGDFEAALALLEEAMSRLPANADAARANVERAIGWTLGRLHRMEEAIERLEHAVAVLAASEDRWGEMKARDQLGMMLHLARRGDDAIGHLERSVALALELGDLEGELARTHLGTVLVRSGYAARARPHLERGIEIAHLMGDAYFEAVGAWAAAEMEDALGDRAAARQLRLRELQLLASIGGNPHNEALAHAHLAHLARLAGDETGSEAEAAAARALAAASTDTGYAARIEEALATKRWSDLETG